MPSLKMFVSIAIFAAFLVQCVAFTIGGGGHGWLQPFWFSIPLWILFPILVVRFRNGSSGKINARAIDWSLLIFAIILDVLLAITTYEDQMENPGDYFYRTLSFAPVPVVLWIGAWISWQGIVFKSLFIGKRRSL